MGLRELDILPAYETLEGEDPVASFYIPALFVGKSCFGGSRNCGPNCKPGRDAFNCESASCKRGY